MKFSIGQVVVHPHHGPATVKKVSSRLVRHERKEYLRLEIHGGDLSVGIPTERAEEIGVRPIIDVDAARGVFNLLLAPSEDEDKVWSRRIKSNTARLRSGDVETIAGLIRDLTRRNEEKRLSFGEMTLLREATGPLAAELALVLSITEEAAEEMIRAAVIDGTQPSIADPQLATAS